MPRYVVQSAYTAEFVFNDPSGDRETTPSLAAALRYEGVFEDWDKATEYGTDYCGRGMFAIIDLDYDHYHEGD